MKFNIVEDTRPRYEEKYEEFIRLYNEGLLITEILKRLEWGKNTYSKARKKALADGLISDRSKRPEKPTYYHRNNKGFNIERRVNGEIIRTWCKTEEEAKSIVRYFNRNGWTKRNLEKYKEKRKCM